MIKGDENTNEWQGHLDRAPAVCAKDNRFVVLFKWLFKWLM